MTPASKIGKSEGSRIEADIGDPLFLGGRKG